MIAVDLGVRTWTMDRALAELTARGGYTIVETGCARTVDDWTGDGMSTVVFGQWAQANGGRVDSVDIDPTAVANARDLTFDYPVSVWCGDSLAFLEDWWKPPIDLLYLDSFDYPLGALLEEYGGKTDIHAAMASLEAMTQAEIVEKHGAVIRPSQEHALAELRLALPNLHAGSLVLIDDAGLPGGGKARLAKRLLADREATCLAEGYQSLWSLP